MTARSINLCATILLAAAFAPGQTIPTTGSANPGLDAIDQAVFGLLKKYDIAGAQLAFSSNGSLILSRGYGVGDRDTGELVQPDSIFRIASLSKSITAFTVLKLVEEGKIELDRRAWDYIPNLKPMPGESSDPRLTKITVRMLMNHTGGWDAAAFEPAAHNNELAAQYHVPTPVSSENLIRVMLGRPLQFDPGTTYHYFNTDYTILARIVESVCDGLSYEQCARVKILAPAGANSMRIAQTAIEGRQPKEVRYYPYQGIQPTTFSFGPAKLPTAYGGFVTLDAADSSGGWLATANDLIRVYTAVQGRGRAPLLSQASLAELERKPDIAEYANANQWYGTGLNIQKANPGVYWSHNGSFEGTYAKYFRYSSVYDYVILLNGRPNVSGLVLDNDFDSALQSALNTAVAAGFRPGANLMTTYPSAAAGAPYITVRQGILHGATFEQGVVSGSWLTILGNFLSTVTRTWGASDFVDGKLPESLDGVSVKINGKPAYVYYISTTQVNVLAPADLPEGWAILELTRAGRTSYPVLVEIRRNAPGFFQYSAAGRAFAVAVHLDATVVGDPGAVPGTRFATSGERLLLFGTGFEPAPAGTVATPPQAVTGAIVRFNNTPAVVEGAALISPGLFQTNIVVPQLANGDYNVTIEINSRKSPAGIVVSVHN